ncbi:MAG TPA: phosphodiesterase [Aliiroseovarius sp.]|nr:phosphodiesterase [Aliiroseovarius sp.]
MLIAQISDLHLSPPGELTHGHVDNAQSLTGIVNHINGLTPIPDLAIITGDITDAGDMGSALLARDILSALKCPYHVIPGNHDRREVLRDVFAVPRDGFLNTVVSAGPLALILLDSLDEGAPGGVLCETRLDWLVQAFRETAARPTMVFLHHPPLPLGVPETDEDGFRGAAALAQMIEAHGNTQRICAGHIHLATQSLWAGTLVTTAPSIGMHLTRNFMPAPPPSEFIKSAPAYLLHHLTGAGQLVSHVVTLQDDETAYPFGPVAGDAG